MPWAYMQGWQEFQVEFYGKSGAKNLMVKPVWFHVSVHNQGTASTNIPSVKHKGTTNTIKNSITSSAKNPNISPKLIHSTLA